MDPAARLDLAIGLSLRNQPALTTLLEQIYNPTSPLFRHYLSSEEFVSRFSPSEQDYQAVIQFARDHQLTITGTSDTRLILNVNGAVADIESAFQVSLSNYQHPRELRSFYAPNVEPSVESNLAISDVSGLNNFSLPQAKSHRRALPLLHSQGPRPKSGSGPSGTYAGTDYRTAYVPGVSLDGTGQKVGLLEFDGYYSGDITAYENQFGLPQVQLLNVRLDGFSGAPTRGPNSGNGEVALDIEMVISMAPNLSQLVVYEVGPNGFPNDILNAMSTNTTVKQFSCSWSFGSTPRATMDQLFQKMAAQGQSFFDASGDSGAESGAIIQPDDDPYITLVGGTALATSAGGSWLSESVWNAADLQQSSSGGVSTTYALPAWQQGINMSANHGSTSHRNIPDVSMAADDMFIIADNGLSQVTGGTSAAAPLWAAFTALMNQQAAASGQPPVGFLNPAVYALGTSPATGAYFYDVVTGNNTNGNPKLFLAVPGYDLCTGLGTPTGSSLINALANSESFAIMPGRGFVASGPAGGPFDNSGQVFTLTNTGSSNLAWSISSTAPWLDVTSTPGTLASGSMTTVTVNLDPSVQTFAIGVYTAFLWFTNLTSGLSQNREITLQVGQELVQDGGFEAGDFSYWFLAGKNAAENTFVDDGTTTKLTPHSGTYFAALGQTNVLGHLSQTLPTRAGQPYLLSFWLTSADLGGGTVPNEFQVRWNGQSILDQRNVGAFDWTNYQFVVIANGSASLLDFGFRDDPGYLALDDISVVPIPAPSLSATLPGGGFVTLTWATQAGLNYQPQYNSDLNSSNWTNLGEPVAGSGSIAAVTDTSGLGTQRFYRVVMFP
jgi:subtilase family serine protease